MAYRGSVAAFDRRAVATAAMQASINARLKAQCDLVSPVSICDLAAKLGVRVTFNDINMEGMYQKGRPPRIHLSALRPLVRRTYNCAHELGHHELGHGSSIDELREDADDRPWDDPKEFAADTFAGFVLMPTLGLRHAFSARGWQPETATSVQLYQISSLFGVGYTSLITHLHYGARMISRERLGVLRKSSPKSIRAEILGVLTPQPLITIDQRSIGPIIDAEVKHLLLLPAGSVAEGGALRAVSDLATGRLFEAVQPGICRVTTAGADWAAFVRVSRTEYVGRAEFRHLEEDPDE